MYKRKLLALDHHNPNGFNVNEVSEFRGLVVWLEDQKIRHYRIEDRTGLRDVASSDWTTALGKYLGDLGCPIKVTDSKALLDWLLGYAVRLEYGDNVDKYHGVTASDATAKAAPSSDNPLENLNVDDADFKAGVASLALFLQIPPHTNHLIVLKAVCALVKERLSKDALERLAKDGIKPHESLPLDKIELGFETPDYITAEAAKVLRVLHTQELRNLQTSINQAIVAVQSLTANPKTDTKLGKIGRS